MIFAMTDRPTYPLHTIAFLPPATYHPPPRHSVTAPFVTPSLRHPSLRHLVTQSPRHSVTKTYTIHSLSNRYTHHQPATSHPSPATTPYPPSSEKLAARAWSRTTPPQINAYLHIKRN